MQALERPRYQADTALNFALVFHGIKTRANTMILKQRKQP